MITLIWQRQNGPYRIAVDGPPEAMEALLKLSAIRRLSFPYKKMKVPVNVKFGAFTYQIYSVVKGLPRY